MPAGRPGHGSAHVHACAAGGHHGRLSKRAAGRRRGAKAVPPRHQTQVSWSPTNGPPRARRARWWLRAALAGNDWTNLQWKIRFTTARHYPLVQIVSKWTEGPRLIVWVLDEKWPNLPPNRDNPLFCLTIHIQDHVDKPVDAPYQFTFLVQESHAERSTNGRL
jgi:hypothetical protein